MKKNLLKKEIFEENEKNFEVDVLKILLCKSDEGKFKGYGFIEFSNKESFDKCLKLDGKVFKGRNLVVKESTRNITEKSDVNKKKNNADNNEKKFINKKRKKGEESSIENEIKNDNVFIEENPKNANNKKKKMNNSDFQKLFS